MLFVDRWRGHVADVIVKRDTWRLRDGFLSSLGAQRALGVCTKPFYLNGMSILFSPYGFLTTLLFVIMDGRWKRRLFSISSKNDGFIRHSLLTFQRFFGSKLKWLLTKITALECWETCLVNGNCSWIRLNFDIFRTRLGTSILFHMNLEITWQCVGILVPLFQ